MPGEKVGIVAGRVPGYPHKMPKSLELIQVDTRERAPWSFTSCQHSVQTVTGTLTVGDYALAWDPGVRTSNTPTIAAVEKKDFPGEFVKCCGTDRKRFFKQLRNLRGAVDQPLLIIQNCSLAQIEMGQWRGQLPPAVVKATLLQAMQIVPVLLARDALEAEHYCFLHLRTAMAEAYKHSREFARAAMPR